MNIKRKLLIPAALLLCVAFASCDSKLCYCYEGNREAELYVNSDTPCSAYTTDRRGCVEANERMNLGGIAEEYKKAKAQE